MTWRRLINQIYTRVDNLDETVRIQLERGPLDCVRSSYSLFSLGFDTHSVEDGEDPDDFKDCEEIGKNYLYIDVDSINDLNCTHVRCR